MRPHQEPEHGDGDGSQRHELVAEDALARETGDDLADDAHARQNHDVHSGMRIEPEQVLEQKRIAAQLRIEHADVEGPLQRHQQQRDGDHRSSQNHDDGGRVVRPAEQRQAAPGQAGSAHAVDGDDEVQAGKDRGEAGDEDSDRGPDDVGVRVGGAERSVEGPAGIDAAGDHRDQRCGTADDVQVPAQQVDPGKCQVFGADHQRNEEVAEHRRHRRNQEEEHHDDAVHGEQLVVGVGRNQVTSRGEQLQADQHGEEAADPEHHGDRDEIKDRDALVVCGQQPRLDAVVGVQVVLALDGLYSGSHVTPLVLNPYCAPDASGAGV